MRGAEVKVRSLQGRPLSAHILTPKTGKNGYFAVSRLGLPKRFVIEVTGGKVALRSGTKTRLKRSNAKLMTAVPKAKAKVRNTKIAATIGTTVAARVGIARWKNAASPRAVKLTKQTLRLPKWAQLGTYDRLLKHYVSAQVIHKQAKQGKALNQLIDRIVAKAKKGVRHAALGKGERQKYRPHRQNQNQQRTTRAAIEYVDAVIDDLALGYDIFGPSPEQDELEAINQKLTEISNTLTSLQQQLTSLSDEINAQFATLSLQASTAQFDVLSQQNNSITAPITSAMNELEQLINLLAQKQTLFVKSQTALVNGSVTGLVQNGAATTLQTNLIGSPAAPGLLGTLWNLIVQKRATQAPAAAAAPGTNTALASTKLLTHEHYDGFEPAFAQWYQLQTQMAALTIVYYAMSDLQSGDVWQFSNGQLVPTSDAQEVIEFALNGSCSANPAPCQGTPNSYLQVLTQAAPKQLVGIRQALDTTTSTMWGNFGTAQWFWGGQLSDPPPAAPICFGSPQTLYLEPDFFKTVNGTTDCDWPGAPKGGPAGSGDNSNNWQLLSTDPGISIGSFTQTLGNLNGSGATGLYSQLTVSNNNQNANPSLGIQGAHSLDFTSPSLFPNNYSTMFPQSYWSRLAYAKGPWLQYMWPNVGPPTALFGQQISPLAARNPAGPFMAFDVSNPQAPDLTGRWDPSLGSAALANQAPQYGMPFPSLFATTADYFGEPGFSSSLSSYVPNAVAGMASPWWPSANMAIDGDINTPAPATPGCANYTSAYDPNSSNPPLLSSSNPTEGCVGNIIGTRPATVSDYTWSQPSSIG